MLTQNYYNINNEWCQIDNYTPRNNYCSYIPETDQKKALRLSIINPENKRIINYNCTLDPENEVIMRKYDSSEYNINSIVFLPFSLYGLVPNGTSNAISSTWLSTVGGEVFQITTDQITNDFPAGTACNGYGINSFLILGSGTTAPTINDYKLENCNLNYKITSNYQEYNGSTKVGTRSMIIVPQEENMTVNEIGLYTMNNTRVNAYGSSDLYTSVGKWGDETSTTQIDTQFVMIARTVLDNPLILEKGKSYQFSYSINFATGKDTINH